jgi:hypothetical protein
MFTASLAAALLGGTPGFLGNGGPYLLIVFGFIQQAVPAGKATW